MRLLITTIEDLQFYKWEYIGFNNIILFYVPFGLGKLGVDALERKYIILAKTDTNPMYCNIIGMSNEMSNVLYLKNVKKLSNVIIDLLLKRINQ